MRNGAASPLQPHLSPKAKQREVCRLCTRSLLEAQVLFRHLEIETLKATWTHLKSWSLTWCLGRESSACQPLFFNSDWGLSPQKRIAGTCKMITATQ